MPTFDFTDVDVKINNSGILADGASISTQNNLTELPILGRTATVGQFPNGPMESSFSISYYLRTQHDHAINKINLLKTGYNSNGEPPDTVVIGNITGNSYLKNFNITLTPSEPVKVNSIYTCYHQPSGSLSNKILGSINQNYDGGSGLAHGFTTFITNSTNYNTINIFSLQYNCEIDWFPTYTLGSVFPAQVHFMGGRETFSFERDIYTGIHFSGQTLTGYLNNITDAVIDFYGLGYIRGVTNYLTSLSLTGAIVTNNEVVATLDDFVRIRTEATNHF